MIICSGTLVNGPYAILKSKRPRSFCAFQQYVEGIRSLFTVSMDIVEGIREQRRT